MRTSSIRVLACSSFVLAAFAASAAAPARKSVSLLTSSGPTFQGCPVYPADNVYNQDIYWAPVDPHSWQYMRTLGGDWMKLHPDFGAPQYGKPFAVVDGWQQKVPIYFQYSAQSDAGPYPFPRNLRLQGDLFPYGDRHGIVFDRTNCKVYETYDTHRSGNGFWAGSGAVFNLRSNNLRPDGWTSATAAGLPMFPSLVRYDEVVEQGVIRHALGFAGPATAHAYVHPATHSSGNSRSPWAPPMGARLRLKRNFDLSRYHGQSLVILKALQHYGMFLTDNQDTPFWALEGAQDNRWNDRDLQQLKSVPASAFEVVQLPRFHSGQ